MLIGLLVIWLFHLSVYGDANSWLVNAAIEDVPGYVVVGLVGISYAVIVGVALIPDLNEEPGDADLGDLESRR